MKPKVLWGILGGLGVFFIISSLIITLIEYKRFNARENLFPQGSLIAGVPVGGLNETAAADRISDFYNLPLILEIDGTTLHANPDDLGFSMDPAGLVEQGMSEINPGSFWNALWANLEPQPVDIPLAAAVNENKILTFLNSEIVPRYSQPGSQIAPIPGTTNFISDEGGARLNIDKAAADIQKALLSPSIERVMLQTVEMTESRASIDMLTAFLQHNINWIGYENLVEIYLETMPDGQTLHFAVQNGASVEPDVAFTAASTIKIPIMISALRRLSEPTPEEAVTLMAQMIALSENPPADKLMMEYLDEIRGPLIVSEDLAAMGLENTFLAGFFYLGAPVLQIFETPANTRTDLFLDPDIYNQTIPAEAGKLLSAIYLCAMDGSGLLTDTFPGEISQTECQLMIDILSGNEIGLLIEAGLPPAATAAHKHGWVVELDGLLHSMSDAAIVFSPGGDYILTIFIHDPQQLNFDQGNRLIARLSQTVYNFHNIENQAHWWFE